ncbi:hypothetical protein M409DRAFT_49740 [Zasmidium cellare ATCC 36951]|uniref:BZIP domain-containing protein n=1 Tax=Zasmidium cellare ATCC 36951 TaxID=1080233 RepID=A0A6A6D4Z3_ZASCE|nr:uncharacterized protein M409DRAFT_49740 [Zasmidium cellare ATCC 36951]KAF2173272.1 hypothetical protein M409DRAFT_49740 [Zasmidium cellare ATCC 36951]
MDLTEWQLSYQSDEIDAMTMDPNGALFTGLYIEEDSASLDQCFPNECSASSSLSEDDFSPTGYQRLDPHTIQNALSEDVKVRYDRLVADKQAKRKAQNRAAQRAFRERKQQVLQDLEKENGDMKIELGKLHAEIAMLRKSNVLLRARAAAREETPLCVSPRDRKRESAIERLLVFAQTWDEDFSRKEICND